MGGRNFGRKPGDPSLHPIFTLIGIRFAVERAMQLTSIVSGEHRFHGICAMNGRPLTFDYWFPHLEVAADVTSPAGGRDESILKFEWCAERGIAYVAHDERDTATLRQIINARRATLDVPVGDEVGACS